MFSVFTLFAGSLVLAIVQKSYFYDYIVSFVIACFSLAYFFDVTRSKIFRSYSFPLFLALIVRLIFLFYDVFTNNPLNIPMLGGELQSDPLGFFTNAVLFSEGYSTYYGGYFSKLIGTLFALTGSSRLWGEFIVLLFSLATIHVTVSILKDLKINERITFKSILLLGLLPNFCILSVVFRRETVITFFVALSIKFFIKWLLAKGGIYFAYAMFFALIASLFHSGAGIICAVYIVILLSYNPDAGKFTLKFSNILMTTVFCGIFIFLFLNFGNIFFSKLANISDLSTVASGVERGESSYAAYVGDSSSLTQVIRYTIPRYFYYMFSPFPWQWRGINDVISFIFSSFFYLFIVIKALHTIIIKARTNRVYSILTSLFIVGLLIAIVFSWGVTNTGTAIRHRDKFLSLYIVMFAISENIKRQNQLNKIKIDA